MTQPTDESPAARQHLLANVVLLSLMTFLHFCGIGSVAINVAWFLWKPSALPLLESPERIGNLIAYFLCGVWALGGVVLAPMCAFGLGTRAPWSRTVTQIYWWLSLVTVCCMPVGAYGLWSLSLDDVKRALRVREP